MLTASSPRLTLAVVAIATVLGVVIGTATAFVVGGRGAEGDARLARSPAATTTTLPEEFYTVVLASIATGGQDSQAAADQRAKQLRDRGIEVGLLNSSDYGSLKRGYLVVYSGRFETEGAAQRHLEQLRAAGLPPGPNPYVREVSDPKR